MCFAPNLLILKKGIHVFEVSADMVRVVTFPPVALRTATEPGRLAGFQVRKTAGKEIKNGSGAAYVAQV